MKVRVAFLRFLVLSFLVGCNNLLPEATPSPAENVILEFESITFSGHLWTPFMPPAADGIPEMVSGLLQIPESSGRIPAMVIAHGCGGISSGESGWAA